MEIEHSIFVSGAVLAIELTDYLDEIMPLVNTGKITPLELDEVAMQKCADLQKRHVKGLTFCDISSLALALTENLNHLATAENQLRRASKKEGIVPLYILDLIAFLLEDGKMTKSDARKFYDDAFPSRKPMFDKMIQEQLGN